MKSAPLLLLLALLVHASSAALHRELAVEKPAHPGKCFVKELGEPLSPGESRNVMQDCRRVACSFENNQLILTWQTCGSVSPPPDCMLVYDRTKPYPDCCGSISCPSQ